MPDVVAFLPGGRTVLRVRCMRDVPANAAACFRTPEEMALQLDPVAMDLARQSLLHAPVVKSPSAEVAADLLWDTIMLKVPSAGSSMLAKLPPVLDSFGNVRNLTKVPIELIALSYVPGLDHMRDHFFKKMKGRERQLMEIIIASGTRLWTKAQLDELVEANAHKFTSTQPPAKILHYYRGQLLTKGFLRRVTYQEYIDSPELNRERLA